MFGYNRIKKLRKEEPDGELLPKAEKAFKDFCKEALKRKKEVLNDEMTDTAFGNRMFKEVMKFEELLGNM